MSSNQAIYNSMEWVGKKFNKLTVIEPIRYVDKRGKKHWFWLVECECGKRKIMRPRDIIVESSVSCGCYGKTKSPPNKTHNESHTRLHNIWLEMRRRCQKEYDPSYKRYGGRGITVCEAWENYEIFAKWARENGYAENLSIERKDVNKGYCPENCMWIPFSKQARNRTTTYWVEYQGDRMSLAEAAEKAGLPYKQVWYRINRSGWSVEKALSTPLKRPPELLEKCKEYGLDYKFVYRRIHMYGWSEEDALNTPNMGKGANQTTYNRSNK